MQDLHILPKLRDSLSYVYAERAVVQRYRNAVELVDEKGKIAVPIASLSLLLLGPGTSITHEAVKLLAQSGCSIVWVGEDATRFYAQGTGETRKAHRLLKQASLVSDPQTRRKVALAMYTKRFDEVLDPDLSLEQIRGHEGVRVRNTYQLMSRRYGVKWRGRRYTRNDWDASDPVNRALSMANASAERPLSRCHCEWGIFAGPRVLSTQASNCPLSTISPTCTRLSFRFP